MLAGMQVFNLTRSSVAVTRTMSKDRKFNSVWDAIESTPQQAASMRARSELMMALQEWVKAAGKTQAETAKVFGVTQPRMSDLTRGRLHLFSLEMLMDMATTAGMEPHIAIKRRKTTQNDVGGPASRVAPRHSFIAGIEQPDAGVRVEQVFHFSGSRSSGGPEGSYLIVAPFAAPDIRLK